MIMTAKGASRSRQEAKRLTPFGKMWKSGDSAIVLYPMGVDEEGELGIIVTECWGYKINPKLVKLGRIFIPTNAPISDGVPEFSDALNQFSRLAPLFPLGDKEARIKDVMEQDIPEQTRKTSLEQIEADFKDISSAVGKLENVISTECIYIPLNDKGEPVPDKARLVTQDLSDERIDHLNTILEKGMFPKEPGDKYLEVQYTFGTKDDRKQDGKVAPTGVAGGYRLRDRFPEALEKLQKTIDRLPEDSEMIFKRNSSFRKVDESSIIQGLTTYAVVNAKHLNSLDGTDSIEKLERNVSVLDMLNVKVKHSSVMEKLKEYKQKQEEFESENNGSRMRDLIEKEELSNARVDAGETEVFQEEEIGGIGDLSVLGSQVS